MLTVDTRSVTPIATQVADALRYSVASGDLPPGAMLPPVRQLAADLRVNFNTIARAYRLLESEGLVRSSRGRGTTVVESRCTAPGTSESGLRDALRRGLSKARLGGMDRRAVERLIGEEIRRLWPRPTAKAGARRR